MLSLKKKVPEDVRRVTEALESAGYSAYLVGGCTRDLLRGEKPKDWDITTNAHPEQIMALFGEDEAFYENDYGTVTVKNEEATDPTLRNTEITPYRIEATYSNYRHPDEVKFSETLEDDLKRRDFTINAIAYSPSENRLVDPYNGQSDIKDSIVKAVGEPSERFNEDALRMMRAVRLASQLGFSVEHATSEAIAANAALMEHIAVERIQQELTKLLVSREPMIGVALLERLGLLPYVLPELTEGIGIEQNGDHIYDVWEHNLRTLQHAADNEWSLELRLAALLHDVGKPATREWSEERNDYTFYGHDVVGAKISTKALSRLKYSKDTVNTVRTLVRHHMFFSDPDQITLSAVRRIIARVGKDRIWDLVNLRTCDRIGMGRPKARPYRLRKYESMIEEALRDPVSVSQLKIDGSRLIEITRSQPGPKLGHILHALLNEILEDPGLNRAEYLEKRALELFALPEDELAALGAQGRQRKDQEEEKELEEIRKNYGVK